MLAIGSSGCNFTLNTAPSDANPPDARPDASRDVGSDAPLNPVCFDGPYAIHVCIQGGLSGTIHVTDDLVIDTGAVQNALPGTTSCAMLATGTTTTACVLAASAFMLDGTHALSAHGPLPLIVLADTVQIDGLIDVASHSATNVVGAMASPMTCDAGTLPTAGAAGGGAGGSYVMKGGNGGDQDGDGGSGGTAGAKMAVALVGGCSGQDGGTMGGAAGTGGGAIAIVATTSIAISGGGGIDASGGAGGGAPAMAADRGAGGGGSGGAIALQAPTIDNDGQVYANGGGGGGGCNMATAGAAGGEAIDATTKPAGGTAGVGGAGDGGDGFYDGHNSANGKPGTNNNDGGGGGGGGAGIVFASTKPGGGGDISPAVTTP